MIEDLLADEMMVVDVMMQCADVAAKVRQLVDEELDKFRAQDYPEDLLHSMAAQLHKQAFEMATQIMTEK